MNEVDFLSILKESELEYVKITPKQGKTEICDSKYGGQPYLPNGIPFPANESGKPMLMIAQINFSDIPAIKDYPTKGLLQFYIDADLITEYISCEGLQYKVLFFEDYDAANANTEALNSTEFYSQLMEDNYGILIKESHLSFELDKNAVIGNCYGSDINRETYFPDESVFEQFDMERVYEENFPYTSRYVSKIGGYPALEENDIRESKEQVLLFQLCGYENPEDSDDFCAFGEPVNGNIGFYIYKEDLLKKNFENVVLEYNFANH